MSLFSMTFSQAYKDIKMPTQQELLNVIGGFHEIAGFPNVIGSIDGTLIRIKSSPNDEHLLVNRKKLSFN